jgi:hypothetical protein
MSLRNKELKVLKSIQGNIIPTLGQSYNTKVNLRKGARSPPPEKKKANKQTLTPSDPKQCLDH